MATLAIGAAFAAVGGYAGATYGAAVGITAVSGAAIGFSVGTAVADYALAPTLKAQGPRIQDLTVQGSQYGAPIPTVWGAVRIAGQIVWSSGIKETKHTSSGGGGGKFGGGGGSSIETFTYSASFAVMLCAGPVGGIRRLWADKALIYDASAQGDDADVLSSNLASAEFASRITFYRGDEAQVPDALIASDARYKDTGAPAYRGRAYLMVEGFQLAKFGNRLPLTVEAELFTHSTGAGEALPLRSLAVHRTWPGGTALHSETFQLAGDLSFSSTVAGAPDNRATVSIYVHRYKGKRALIRRRTVKFPAPTSNLDEAKGSSDYRYMICVDNASDIWALDAAAASAQPLGLGFGSEALGAYVKWCRRADKLILRYISGASGQQVWTFEGTPFLPGYTPAKRWARKRHFASPDIGIAYAVTLSPDGRTSYILSADAGDMVLYSFDTVGADAPAEILRIDRIGQVGQYGLDSTDAGLWIYDGWDRLYLLGFDGTLVQAHESAYGRSHLTEHFLVGLLPMLIDHGGGDVWQVPAPPVVESVEVGDIVRDLAASVGASVDTLDIAGQTVTGYIRSRTMAARAAVEPLQQVRPFDIIEAGDSLRVVARGGAPGVTIEGDTLVSGREFRRTRAQDLELPRRVVTQYLSRDADYQPGTQQAQRIETRSVAEAVLELPMVLTDDDAARTAEVMLYSAWQSRETIASISLPPQYMALEPADVIVLRHNNRDLRVRINKIGFTAPGLLDASGTIEDEAVYESSAVGGLVEVPAQVIRYAGSTDFDVLDTHLLRLGNESSGVYVAARGGAGWRGALIYTSANERDWSYAGAARLPATTGRTLTALPAGPTTVVDMGNTVDVELYDGTLSSTDEVGFLSGVNAALIGDEVVLFRTATLIAPDSYRLSVLSRGRLGTEQHMDHPADVRFVLLTTALADVSVSPDSRGRTIYVRAVGEGQTIDQALSQEFTFDNHRAKPWAPAQLGALDLGTGNYTLAWLHRPRYGGEWADGVGVPVADAPLNFRVRTWRAGAMVAEAFTADQTITLAAQAGDEITVAQVSTDYGAGYESTVTL